MKDFNDVKDEIKVLMMLFEFKGSRYSDAEKIDIAQQALKKLFEELLLTEPKVREVINNPKVLEIALQEKESMKLDWTEVYRANEIFFKKLQKIRRSRNNWKNKYKKMVTPRT